MLQNIGQLEIIVIAVVLLIFFGGKKLPELGKGLGDTLKQFKKMFNSKEK